MGQVRVAVLTSCYDAYDPVVAPRPQNLDIDWICVTDGKAGPPPPPWREVIEPRPHMPPRMAAKVARCRPDLYTDADVTVWLDASARLRRGDSVEQLVGQLGDGLIAQWVHPGRTTIAAEAEVSALMRKYAGQPMRQQVDAYYAEGFPEPGLWATGCIVRRAGESMAALGDAWLREMCRWSWQDQISLPFVLWKLGVAPVALSPGSLWGNPLVAFSYELRKRDD